MSPKKIIAPLARSVLSVVQDHVRSEHTLTICLLGFALRVIRLASRPLWYDEAFAILYGGLSPAQMIYGTVTPAQGAGAADVHPLLYYFSLHGWMQLVGSSPLAARFLSVVFGMLTVALLWRLATWVFDGRTGLIVGLLAATNPFHVAYSQEARMYALLGFAAVVTAYGLLRALHADGGRTVIRGIGDRCGIGDAPSRNGHMLSVEHWKWWALYALGAALTLYVHNLGVFTLLALHLLVVTRRRWWCRVPTLALADLVALALFSPWLIGVLPGQLGFVTGGYWLTPPGVSEVLRALMLPVLTFYEPAPIWLLGLGLFVSLTTLALLVLRARRAQSRVRWFLLLCWVPVVALLAISQWRSLYLERALLPAALFHLVAIGWLLAHRRLPYLFRGGLVVLLGVSMAGSLVNHYSYVGFPRPPFQEAAAYLEGRIEPGQVVVHTNKLTYFPMAVYAPQLPAEFLADPAGSPQDTLARPTQEALGVQAASTITQAVGGAATVHLVIFDQEIAQVQGEHPALSWLEAGYHQVDRVRFGDLNIIDYERDG